MAASLGSPNSEVELEDRSSPGSDRAPPQRFTAIGCGNDEKSIGRRRGRQRPSATAEVDGEQVTFGSLVAQIRGHHRAALERHHAGDREAALEHASHPAKEILDSIRPELEQPSPETVESLTQGAAARTRGNPRRVRRRGRATP